MAISTDAPLSPLPLTLTSPAFPPELLLSTLQHLAFEDGKIISTLSKVNHRLYSLLKNYEHSITKAIIRKELPHAPTDFRYEQKTLGYAWLAKCVTRYDIIDEVMSMLLSEMNCFKVDKHNMALVNTGFLLLYRIVDIGKFCPSTKSTSTTSTSRGQGQRIELTLQQDSHATKIAFLQSLPRDPLVALFLLIHHATLTARYHGTGWIHQNTYGRFMDVNQLSLRTEMEFAFAEGILNLGPSFIHEILLRPKDTDAETKLLNIYFDHSDHDWVRPCWGEGHGEFAPPMTHGPERDPESKPKALFTVLLERMAEVVEVPVSEVKARVEAQTDSEFHSLANMGLYGKTRLVQGLNLEETE